MTKSKMRIYFGEREAETGDKLTCMSVNFLEPSSIRIEISSEKVRMPMEKAEELMKLVEKYLEQNNTLEEALKK